MKIFTYKDYLKYKQIIEKRTTSEVAEECEKYYLEGALNNEKHINNQHDKIFRKMLSVKSEATKFINKIASKQKKYLL